MDINDFLNLLTEQTNEAEKNDVSKNLAKEDSLSLIAEFVKTIKKQFSKSADRLEIMNAAKKTLGFYIDEIESEEINFEIPETDFEEEPSSEENIPDDDSGFDEGEI